MSESRGDDDAVRASAGDADALQRLIITCHEPLHAAVAQARAAAMATRIDSDDILQQAYVIAFKKLCPPADGGGDDAGSETANGEVTGERAARQASLEGSDAPLAFESTGHFYKWLETVAVNQLRDMERSLRRQKRNVGREAPLGGSPTDSYPNLVQQLAASDPTPSRALAQAETVAVIMSSLARLPDEQRDVIRWRFLQNVSFAEIADRLGKSTDAVYMICHRGLKTLRGLLVSMTGYLTRR